MASLERMHGQEGATRLRLGDILVALALLGALLYASWKQFPVYRSNSGAHPADNAVHHP